MKCKKANFLLDHLGEIIIVFIVIVVLLLFFPSIANGFEKAVKFLGSLR